MRQESDYLTTGEAATELGVSRGTVWRACKMMPGFAVRLWGAYRIPRSHIERIKRGETPQDIAATAGEAAA